MERTNKSEGGGGGKSDIRGIKREGKKKYSLSLPLSMSCVCVCVCGVCVSHIMDIAAKTVRGDVALKCENRRKGMRVLMETRIRKKRD